MTRTLFEGVYENVVTERIQRELAELEPAVRHAVEHLAEADGHLAQARHLLLTRNRAEPSLGHELAREIAIADQVDAVVAFITVSSPPAPRRRSPRVESCASRAVVASFYS